jgi:Tfp pilus assembly protein PilV
MKKLSFAAMLIIAFGLTALAQSAKVGVLTANRTGQASASRSTAPTWVLPSVPRFIAFYGGEINVNDPNANGFANADTIAVGQASTYGAVQAPPVGKVVIGGTFGNNSAFFGYFDGQGTYDIRTGVSEGNGGTVVQSGTAVETETPTGRDPFGLLEYTTSVQFAKPLTATPGTTYWVNETPQCLSNPNCAEGEFYYLSNSQGANSVNGWAQVPQQAYLNSNYFGYTWANWCDSSLGQNQQQCAYLSFGLTR